MFNNQKFITWVEEYLFYPKSLLQFLLSFLLLPFSLIYCFIILIKRFTSNPVDYKIPIISIGNLTIGGSGKTPFLISLAQDFENVAIILRGYRRESKGLHVITKNDDIKLSGDEAMLYVNALPQATVIVSEDRVEAINKAKELNCKIIFLDDGFSKSKIKKLDILIRPNPEPRFNFCLPSGAYREPKFLYKSADLVVTENCDFKREVTIKNPTKNMLLITAISKPQRLDSYLPENLLDKIYFIDHYMYKKEELENLINTYKASSILTTQKDAVKMKNFNLPLSILDLHVKINPDIKNKINTFLSDFR